MTAGSDRRRQSARRRRRGIVKFALGAAAIGLLVGILIGYAARGGPAAGDSVTVDQTVPVVTVTVPAVP